MSHDKVADRQTADQTLSGFNLFIVTAAISLAAFIFVLDYTVANVALPYIAGSLAVSVDQGTYVLTFFAIGNAVALPLTGWLVRRFGMIHTFIASILLFTFLSWICALSFTLEMLVIARFLQGAAAGPLIPLAQALLTIIYPKAKLNFAMAIFGMVVLVAPVFGPVVGGYLCINYSWHWIFNINIPTGILAAVLMWIFMSKRNGDKAPLGLDLFGFALVLIGMSALQLFLDKGEQWDWWASRKIIFLSTSSFIAIGYLVIWCLTYYNPILKLYFLKRPLALFSNVTLFLSYSVYMGSVVLIPLWLQTAMGYDALWAGIAVAPVGVPSVLLNPFIAKLIDTVGRIRTMAIGFFFIALSCFYVSYFFTTDVDLHHIMISRFILGIGVAFWVVSLFGMASAAYSSEEMSDGLTIFHFTKNLCSGMGIAIYTTIYYRRQIRHHFNLVERFNPFNQNSIDYAGTFQSYGFQGETLLTAINNSVDQQAALLALNDIFWLMGWLSVILIFFCLISNQLLPAPKHPIVHVIDA